MVDYFSVKLPFISCLTECDKACMKSCVGAGPGTCKECAKGYRIKEDGDEDDEEEDEEEDDEDEQKEGEHNRVVTCEGMLFLHGSDRYVSFPFAFRYQ